MFTKSYPLFSILGFRVSLDLSWFFLAFLITWNLATAIFPGMIPGREAWLYYFLGVIGAVGIFGSIVFHELAHALMARYYNIEIGGITLFIFGGVAELNDEPPTPLSEFLIAIVGPISSFLLAGICYLLSEYIAPFASGETLALLYYLQIINFILAVFNLVPAFPLDGGRVLRSALWWWTGSMAKSTHIAGMTGMILGGALMAYGAYTIMQGDTIGGMWQILIGYFIVGAARLSKRQIDTMEALRGVHVRQIMQPSPLALSAQLPLQQIVDNERLGDKRLILPVVEDDRLVGMIKRGDIDAVTPAELHRMTLSDIMKPAVPAQILAPDQAAISALRQIRRNGMAPCLVVENGRLIGSLMLLNILDYMDRHENSAGWKPKPEISTK